MGDASTPPPAITDVVAIAKLISDGREKDKDFQALLNEISTALVDLVGHQEGNPDKLAEALASALTRVLAPALKAALAQLPAPTVTVPAPSVNVAPPQWEELEFEVVEADAAGLFTKLRCTRRA